MLNLFLALFTALLGFGISLPLLPFLALRFGASAQEVTLLIATYSFVQLFAAPVWGRVSDRWGRKPVLLIGLAGAGFSYLILAMADQLLTLILARAVAGLFCGDIVAAQAYVADTTTPENRAKGMGVIGAAFGLAFIFGPGLGAWLVGANTENPDFVTPLVLATALCLVSVAIACLRLKESLQRSGLGEISSAPMDRGLWLRLRALRYPHLGLVTAVLFLLGFAISNMESTLALWVSDSLDWGPREVGMLLVYAGVIAVVFQLRLVGPLSRKFGEAMVALFATGLIALGMAGIVFAGSAEVLLGAMASIAAGMGLGNPSLQSLISRLSKAGGAGGALGLGQSAASLARALGPLWAGMLYQSIGRNAPYVAAAMIATVAAALAFWLARRLSAK